jgi:hypothetical protein
MVKRGGFGKTGELYRVWISNGQGLNPGPGFRLLDDAKRHVAERDDDASYAIQAPDGTWEAISSRMRIARGTSAGPLPPRTPRPRIK